MLHSSQSGLVTMDLQQGHFYFAALRTSAPAGAPPFRPPAAEAKGNPGGKGEHDTQPDTEMTTPSGATPGDAQHDRYERVYHGGTFNANPYCAATGNAALNIVATGEMQANADRMAERLRVGLREIVDRYEVAACVYGESSTFHIFFGAKSIDGLDANSLKSAPPEVQTNFRQGLQVRGVDLMSRTSGVLSGVHTEADIDQSLEAFDGTIKAMMDEGLISHE